MKKGQDISQSPSELARELLSFGQTPGRYALHLGEPKALFSRLETVAQWASGRLPAELQTQAQPITAAAVLFIQRACFAPGNTHYQILGLTPSSLTPELLRTRYRSLIRLTHPDMGIAGLPADAAGMVNRSLDVLSDESARRRYDEQLQKSQAPRPPPAAAPTQAADRASRPHMGAGPGWSPSGYERPRRRAPAVSVARKQGLSERWLGLMSQYPRQIHWALVAGVILVPVGLVLFWAAQDTTKGGVLVASKPPPPPSSAKPAEARRTETTRTAMQNAPKPQQTLPAERKADAPTAAKPQPAQNILSTAQATAAKIVAPVAPDPSATPASSATIYITSAPAVEPARQPSAQPDRSPPPQPFDLAMQAAEHPPPAPSPTRATERAPTQAFAASAPAEAAPFIRKVATSVAAPAQAPAPAPAPRATAPRESAPAPAIAPPPAAPTPAAPVPPAYNVDVTEAKRYLAEIVGTLESAPRARHLQDYLSSMKVRGTLLRPALDFITRYPDLSVHRSGWAEDRQPGLLTLRSSIVLRPASAGSEARLYNLHAEFRSTDQGTMLVRLELTQ